MVTRCKSVGRWRPDDEVSGCQQCKAKFSLLTRRHHCRECGDIFCSSCTTKTKIIPQVDRLRPQRVCDMCYKGRHRAPPAAARDSSDKSATAAHQSIVTASSATKSTGSNHQPVMPPKSSSHLNSSNLRQNSVEAQQREEGKPSLAHEAEGVPSQGTTSYGGMTESAANPTVTDHNSSSQFMEGDEAPVSNNTAPPTEAPPAPSFAQPQQQQPPPPSFHASAGPAYHEQHQPYNQPIVYASNRDYDHDEDTDDDSDGFGTPPDIASIANGNSQNVLHSTGCMVSDRSLGGGNLSFLNTLQDNYTSNRPLRQSQPQDRPNQLRVMLYPGPGKETNMPIPLSTERPETMKDLSDKLAPDFFKLLNGPFKRPTEADLDKLRSELVWSSESAVIPMDVPAVELLAHHKRVVLSTEPRCVSFNDSMSPYGSSRAIEGSPTKSPHLAAAAANGGSIREFFRSETSNNGLMAGGGGVDDGCGYGSGAAYYDEDCD